MTQQIRIKTSTGWKLVTDVLLNKGNSIWESVENAYVKTSGGWKNVFSSVDVTNRPRPVTGSGPTLSTNSRLGSGEFTQGSVITVTRGDWQRMSSTYDPVYYNIKIQISEDPATEIWTTVKESAFSMSVTSLTYTIKKGDVNRPSYYFRAIVYAKNKYGLTGETLPKTIDTYNPYYLSYKDLNAQFVAESSVYKSTSIAWSYAGSGIDAADVSKVEITISSLTDDNFSQPQTYLLTTSQLTQFGITGNTTPTGNFISVPNYNPYEYNYYLTLWFYAEDTKQDREPTMPREYFDIGPIGNKIPQIDQDPDISAANIYGPTTITGTNYHWSDLGSYTLNYYFDMATPDPDALFDYVPDSSTDPAYDSPRWNSVSSGTITNPATGSSNIKTYLAPDPGIKPPFVSPWTGETITNAPQVNYYRFRVVATKANALTAAAISQSPITVEHQSAPGSITVTDGTITQNSWSLNISFGDNTTRAVIEYGTSTGYGFTSEITASGTFTPIGPLVPGTTYYYRVTPYNINLAGQSVTGTISTSATVPGPASNVSIENVPGRDYNNGQVLISWSAPTYTGGAPIDYYRVQYAYDYDYSTWYTLSDNWTGTAMYAGPWTDGYTIKAKIWPHNAKGYTTQSAISATAAYINTLPEVPTLLTAVKASSTSIAASFTPNVNYGGTKGTGGSALTYLLWVMPTDGSSGFSKTITTSPSTITGLLAGKEYNVRVRATNDQGYVYSNSIIVDLVDRTPVATPGSTVLSLQSGLAGRPNSSYRITAPSFTNSPTQYYFSFDRNDAGGNSYANSGWISNNYWDYTFSSETTVSMSAVAYARNTSATSIGVYSPSVVPIIKIKPGAPTITTSSSASSWSIGVTFGTNTTSVGIEYGTDTNYGTLATLTSSGTFTPIGPFASNTTYYYRVTPYNASSPGDSITGSVTTQILLTPPGPARNVSISQTAGRNYDDGQITITWDAPLNNGNATVDYYRVQYAYADVNGSYANSTWNTLSDTWASSPMTAGPYMAGLTVKAKVWSHNSQGYTSTSAVSANEVFITTKPEAPTLLTATKASSSSIATTFTPSVQYGGSKGLGGLTTIYELRARNNDNSIVTGKTVTTSPSTITGLSSSTSYDVYIAASNTEGTVYSNTIVVGFTPPSNSSAPQVTPASGTAGVASFSVNSNGTWSGNPSYSYQWKYNNGQFGWTSISGATSTSYSPPANYVSLYGSGLLCTITASNAGGSTAADSNTVTVNAPVSPPTGSVSISPSGTVQARTLITATSSFTNLPTSSYIEIRKATGRTPTQSDTLVASSASTQVTYTITDSEASGTPDRFIAFAYASNSGGTSTTYSSNVVTSTPYVPPVLTPTNASSASWSLVSGTSNRVGATYRLNFGSWNNIPTYYIYEISINNAAGTVLASDSSGNYTNTFVDYTFTSTSSSTVSATVKAGNSAGLSTASSAGSIGPILSNVVAPSGGTVTLTGNATAGSVITASTSGWSGSPTSYATIITTALSPNIPTSASTAVATGTTSATYTITSSDTISPVNIFRAFTTASNSAGSASVQSSNYITSQGAIAPFFPPYFVPPFFPPYFVPPFFPPYFVSPFFPPYFVPPFFPPYFPPYFVPPFFPPYFPPYFVPPFFPPYFPPYFVPPFFPSGCTACNSGNCPDLYCFCGGPCDYECYC